MNKFIELTEDKTPIVPEGSKVADHFTDSMDGMENAGMQLPLDVVVVDFDGYNVEEEYYIQKYIEEYDPFWVKTVRGYHLYFKKPKGIKFQKKACLTWIGLQGETLVTLQPKGKKDQTYAHPMVKQFGKERERKDNIPFSEVDLSKLPELPKDLYPLYVAIKRKNQMFSLSGTVDGERNLTMNEHLFFIRSQYEIDGEELWEYAQKINNTMFVPPLDDKDLRERWKSAMEAEIQPRRGGMNKSNGEDTTRRKKDEFTIDFLDTYIKTEMKAGLSYDPITKKYMWENLTICKEHQVPTYILDKLRHDMKGVTKDIVRDFLDFIMFANERNIILEKIEGVKWDGLDRLIQIYDILGVTDEFDQLLIKKWMWQTLTLLYNVQKEQTNDCFGADGCLVFQGKRGIGKTEFFKYLCSFAPKYFKMGAKLKFENKDTVIEALGHWIVELGEVETTFKKTDVTDLKNFITCDEDEVRLPYGRGSRKTPRMTSFCATCNSKDFLRDETGNRRFWVVQLPDRNISRKQLYAIDVLQLWRQIFEQCEVSLSNSGFRLNDEEKEMVNTRTEEYQVPLKGEDTVRDIIWKIIHKGENDYTEEYTTVTEWMEIAGNFKNLTTTEVAKVLNKLGYECDNPNIRINGQKGRFRKLPIPIYKRY